MKTLYKLNNLDFYILKQDLEDSLNAESLKEIEIKDTNVINSYIHIILRFKLKFFIKTRHNRRKYEFIKENFKILNSIEEFKELLDRKSNKRNIIFRYFLTPVKINGKKNIQSVEFSKNNLKGQAFNQISVEKTDLANEIINCDVCIRSIGYQAEKIDPYINFDFKNHKIYNSNGCMLSHVKFGFIIFILLFF